MVRKLKHRKFCSRECATVGTPKKPKQKESSVPAEHHHHWVVDSPNGPTSTGRCACGETREFVNAESDQKMSPQDWNQMNAAPRKTGRSKAYDLEAHQRRMSELAEAEARASVWSNSRRPPI